MDAAAIATNWKLITDNLATIGPALLLCLLLLLAISYFTASLLGRTSKEAKTIAIETSMQNGTLGITVASLIVGGAAGVSEYALPSAVYGILMYLVIPILLTLGRRNPE